MHTSLVDQIASLGVELNANQYKVVRLSAQYDVTLEWFNDCLLYTSPSPRDATLSRMPSSA